MTNPTLPNADELEVVGYRRFGALLDPLVVDRRHRADPATFDLEPLVTLSSAQEQIERITRERDEARRGEYAANEHEPTWCEVVAVWKTKAEAAEAEVKRLREVLKPFGEYLVGMPCDLDNKGRPIPDDDGVGWVYLTVGDFRRARSALSGGTRNDR